MDVVVMDQMEMEARLLPKARELARDKYATMEWTLHRSVAASNPGPRLAGAGSNVLP